jgi:prevent-host-death family protein
MIQVNIYDAKARLSELVDRAEKGERVVIAKAGVPKVVLTVVSEEQPKQRRVFGGGGAEFAYAGDHIDDFTDEEMAALFEGSDLE